MEDVAGFVDYIEEDGTIVGWCTDTTDPVRILEIEVVLEDGRVIANARADNSRLDVSAVGAGPERCGFRVSVDRALTESQPFSIRVVRKTSELVAMPPVILRVDRATRAQIAGWVAIANAPLDALTIEAVAGGAIVGTAAVDLPRHDVVAAGYATRNCGFHLDLPPSLAKKAGTIVLNVKNGDALLAKRLVTYVNSAILGNIDDHKGHLVRGWVRNVDIEGPATIEAVVNGEVVTTTIADIYREDLLHFGQARARCGFHIVLPPKADLKPGDVIVLREQSSREEIAGSPFLFSEDQTAICYANFFREKTARSIERFRARQGRGRGASISIVMPVYDPKASWLEEAIESVRSQWSPRWQLICVDDCSSQDHVAPLLARYAAADPRIVALTTARNGGIAAATNLALAAAAHDILLFMDHDDVLEPNAVHMMLKAFERDDVDLAYSDEVVTSDDIDVFMSFRARPAFSYDYYLSHPYFVHTIACRKSIATAIGGLNEDMTISQDVDFVLRALERCRTVAHVPLPLYRWRTHSTSTGHLKKDKVTAATVGALTRSLDRLGPGCRVLPGDNFNEYRVLWPARGGRTLVVVPTRDNLELLRLTVDTLMRTTPADEFRLVVVDHESADGALAAYLSALPIDVDIMPYVGAFNFSRMNNLAVARFGEGCEFVLFLNDDIEAESPGWLARLRSLAARHDVGAVAPLLLFPNRKVQHAGVIIGFNEVAEHAQKFGDAFWSDSRSSGYNAILTSCRDYSAVTAACLMMRKSVFDQVGGFDEDLANAFNDTDLCLRLGEAGLKVLYDGQTVLTHHESATRAKLPGMLKHPADTARFRQRWAAILEEGDAFYNPAFEISGTDHVVRGDRAGRNGVAIRYRPAQLGGVNVEKGEVRPTRILDATA